jgi:hypothetical protein
MRGGMPPHTAKSVWLCWHLWPNGVRANRNWQIIWQMAVEQFWRQRNRTIIESCGICFTFSLRTLSIPSGFNALTETCNTWLFLFHNSYLILLYNRYNYMCACHFAVSHFVNLHCTNLLQTTANARTGQDVWRPGVILLECTLLSERLEPYD